MEATMKWIETVDGAVNALYVVRLVRDGDDTVLHLRDGTTLRSLLEFEVVKGELIEIEFDDDEVPF